MMKKTLSLWGIALATLLAGTACTNRPASAHYVVQGELSDSASHGKTIYLMRLDDHRNLDSTVVEGNRFRFEGTIDTAAFCHINIKQTQYANLILEGGHITVYPCFEGCEKPSGTPMNEAYAAIQTESDSIYSYISRKREELYGQCLDPQQFKSQWHAVYDSVLSTMSHRALELFREHGNDAVGNSLFGSLFCTSVNLDTKVQICQLMGPWLSSTIRGQSFKRQVEGQIRTAEGQPYANIAGTDTEGHPVSLSDYIGKGNYVLMDMWASWCGPCRGETPNLRQLHERYGSKGLTVVGMFVYDQVENLKTAVEQEQITWPQVVDTANVAMDTYGTNGIPFIVLFAPDGTILKRDLRGSDMIETIDEIMTQPKK